MIGQAHHGSGKTGAFSLGILSRVDLSKKHPQVIVLCPTRELAIQVADVLKTLAAYMPVDILAAVPNQAFDRSAKGSKPPPSEKITAQIIVGTPGTIDNKIAHRDLDPKGIIMFVADEADQMIAQEGLGDKTVQIKKRLPKSTQILLFSATFDDATKKFAKVVAPQAVEIMVKTEELSLDGIKQYFMGECATSRSRTRRGCQCSSQRACTFVSVPHVCLSPLLVCSLCFPDCRNEEDKYKALTDIFGLLQIGQSIIFVHTVATAKILANKMRADGYTISLLHGKDMPPQERDRVMSDFRSNKTSVLITTNVLARGIDVLSVTLVINFDVPLTRHGRPDPETYIHRIGRSGRFGRKGVAINFVHDPKSRQQLGQIAEHFKKNIVALPRDDLEKVTELVQKDLK